jgi:hypothetical protein
MKRYKTIKTLTSCLKEDDLGIFIGKGICNEGSNNREGFNIYLDSKIDGMLSFALGIAICTDKRVFIFCDNRYFIKNVSEFMQISVSKCKNLFLVLLLNEYYEEVSDAYIISNNLSIEGLLYNLGIISYNYTKLLNNDRNPSKVIKGYWEWIKGPAAMVINLDKGSRRMPEQVFSSKEDLAKIKFF